MKTLYESILDDENVLMGDLKEYINNPIAYFISKYTIGKINNKYNLQKELDHDEKFLNLIKEFFKFDDGIYWEVNGVKSQDYIKNPKTRTVKLKDNNGDVIMNLTHMSEFSELHVCLLKPEFIRKNLHKNYIKNFSKIKSKIEELFNVKYSTFRTNNWGFFVIKNIL